MRIARCDTQSRPILAAAKMVAARMVAAAMMAAAAGLVTVCLQGACVADQPGDPPNEALVKRAAERGLRWLAEAQHADGSWGSTTFRGSAAVTAQVMMAALATGSTPASGPHAEMLARGVEYLAGCSDADGLIAGNEQAAHGPMYAHAFATMALAEAYGEAGDDPRLADILTAARGLIERTQNDEGGWRYLPQRRDADLSVTAAMLVTMRALHDSGFAVSDDSAERAGGFLARLQNDDGGFRYLAATGPSGAPRTAAALCALLVAGRADRVIERGFAWLEDHPIVLESADGYALYGLSYEAAARWRWQGRHAARRAAWETWHATTAARLLAAQNDDGSWSDPSCPEYGTAAAISILTMPDGLVPLFQPEPVDIGTEAP